MKKEILYDKVDDFDRTGSMLRILKSIEQTLEREISSKQDVIEWQQEELRRLRAEVLDKDGSIVQLNGKLMECHSQSKGNRQLINKLITDIDKLHQDIDWYKRTYEARSLFGVIKDKLKYFFK